MTTQPIRAGRPIPSSARTRDAAMLGVFLLISYAVATFGSVATIANVTGWYAHTPHVPWTPPNWLFAPVWTVLYGLIAVAEWLVWRQRTRVAVAPALALYTAQLVLNALWVPVFFAGYPLVGGAALWVGLAVILILDLAVGATIVSFWPLSRPAALLLVPYLAWLLFASTLNWGDAALNSFF